MFGPSKRELLRVIERERNVHRQEIGSLLDRIADLSGKPWTLPPRPVEPREEREDEIARDFGPLEEL
jgi:hypothetical protein